jgi:transcriptional regulator with XRE-family HTH domain
MRAYSTSPRPVAPPARPGRKNVEAARDVNQHVARRLKTLRRIRFKTQTDLGAALGKTFQQVAHYESGYAKITPSTLWRAAEYLNVDVEYFFEDLEPAMSAPDRCASDQRTTLRVELVMALSKAAISRDLLLGLRDLLRAYRPGERAAGRNE